MPAPNQPNVLLISCHDLGQHLSCYGLDTVNSPNIDRLADQGVRFERSFCTAPQCSPSRAAIYTGRFPHANGVMGLCHDILAWDLNDDEVHLARRLHDVGYRTTLVGIQHETRHPERMGYDEITPLASMKSPTISRGAAECIRQADTTQPQYWQVGFFDPHRVAVTDENPYAFCGGMDESKGVTVPPYLVDEPSARKEFAAFQAAVKLVDDGVGEILQALEDSGQADRTIVIFTADHGIPFPRAKCSLYDPGLEVPFIVRWPGGGIEGGRVQREMISNVDYLPTLLELLGLDIPDNVQGLSQASLLKTGQGPARTEIFGEMTYHDYYDPKRCIRTEDFKLIVNFSRAPVFMKPTQDWRPLSITVTPEDPGRARHFVAELYDLANDPLEQNNRIDDEELADVRADLFNRLHAWMQQTADPLLEGVPISPTHRMAWASLQQGREVRRMD